MAVVTNIGFTLTDQTNASFTLAATVPAGATIIVAAEETSASTITFTSGQITDSAGNTYILAETVGNGVATGGNAMWYCPNALGISAGTIRYTKAGAASDNARMTACYFTGSEVFDPAVKGANTSGSSTGLTITSGTPSEPGEVLFGYCESSGGTLTNDAAWTMLNQTTGFIFFILSTRVNSGGSPVTFHPTWSTAAPCGGIIIGFGIPVPKVAGMNMPMLGF